MISMRWTDCTGVFIFLIFASFHVKGRQISGNAKYTSTGLVFIQQEKEVSVPEGSVGYLLQCPLNHNADSDVSWTLGNSRQLSNDIVDMGGGTLLFSDVTMANQGKYVCHLKDKTGHDETASIMLRIHRKARNRNSIPQYETIHHENPLLVETSTIISRVSQTFSTVSQSTKTDTKTELKGHNKVIGPVMGVCAVLFCLIVCVICCKGNICKSTNTNNDIDENSSVIPVKNNSAVSHQPKGDEESNRSKMSRPVSFFA